MDTIMTTNCRLNGLERVIYFSGYCKFRKIVREAIETRIESIRIKKFTVFTVKKVKSKPVFSSV